MTGEGVYLCVESVELMLGRLSILVELFVPNEIFPASIRSRDGFNSLGLRF